MKQRFGILLFDSEEIIFRIYEADDHEWKLLHYHSAVLENFSAATEDGVIFIMEIIAEFFNTEYAQHIAEWKACSRHLPQHLIDEISNATALKIENITLLREQELLCKGMFTELW